MNRVVHIDEDAYVLIRKVDPEWVDRFGKKSVYEAYGGSRILYDEIGRVWVADQLRNVEFIEIKEKVCHRRRGKRKTVQAGGTRIRKRIRKKKSKFRIG